LMSTLNEGTPRILFRTELEQILKRIQEKISSEGTYHVAIASMWQGGTRWARNRVRLASDRKDICIKIFRYIDGGMGSAQTNQIDDVSIAGAVRYAEWRANLERRNPQPIDKPLPLPDTQQMPAKVWSDATYQYQFPHASRVIQRTTSRADSAGVMAAGYLESFSGAVLYHSTLGRPHDPFHDYAQLTQAHCSVTVRHPSGLGSGWAGVSSYDLNMLNADALADRAMDKCLSSLHPVRIEPGRYTAILEPQAVSDIVTPLIRSRYLMSRSTPEAFNKGPFFLGFDSSLKIARSKLGLKIVDERISVWHDPTDPELGIVSPSQTEHGLGPITWIKNGVLTTLAYPIHYATNRLGETDGASHRMSYRMSGGETTLDEMIASTERGILVTRFSQPTVTHAGSMMASGLTRDGLWLIEGGKITHAIRNFRTLESPLFALNNVEQLGVPTPVFNPGLASSPLFEAWAIEPHNALASVIVPPLKIRDFSFSSTIDAV
jgi:predicted Zn-dependent protease